MEKYYQCAMCRGVFDKGSRERVFGVGETDSKVKLYAQLVNEFGVGSPQEQSFLRENQHDHDFLELARLTVCLKQHADRYVRRHFL